METFGESEDGAGANREMESWHQLPVEEDPSQFLGQTSGLVEDDGLQGITLNSEGQSAEITDSSMKQAAERFESLQLEQQDSCLSPALILIPQEKTFLPSESTLLHQTDLEFLPLRGSPDVSAASERCPQMSRLIVDGQADPLNRSHDQASLSQHQLGVMSAIIEDVSSCCSLSQHSLSPSSNYQTTHNHYQHPELDLGVASRSAVPSSTETVLSQTDAALSSTDYPKQSFLVLKDDPACIPKKESQIRPSESREQPQAGSSFLMPQRKSVSLSPNLSAISNITVRATSKQTLDTTDLHLKQHQVHGDSLLSILGGRNQTENKNTSTGHNITPTSEGGVHGAGLQRELWSSGRYKATDGSFLTSQPVFQSTPSVLFYRGAPAPAKLSPVYSYQDTMATSTQHSPKPDDLPPLTLSTSSHPSGAGAALATSLDPGDAHTESHLPRETPHSQETPSLVLDVPVATCEDTPLNQPTLTTLMPTSNKQLKDQETTLSAGRVHSLPSLSYVQKVDAWKANQSSSGSFYESLSLHGLNGGVPFKRNEQDSVSEAEKQQSQQQPKKTTSAFSASNSTLPTQTGSGLLPSVDVEEAGGAVRSISPSPFTHSHSHSSLGTVITPIQQDELQQNVNQLPLEHTDTISPGVKSTAAESLQSLSGTNNQQPADEPETNPLKNPALLNLDQYSGMNTNSNRSNTVSSFPAGYHLKQSFQASIGASSVVSLEVDNYAPYWTSRPGSPPHPSEFNIEDRIPLYLHNLGIDQSPSTILNPFTRRGPIREPEFSPTDLCTIKGSVGSPTKSIQPSDADSLQKETFSSSSVLSADSNASLTQLFIPKSTVQPTRPSSSGSIRRAHFQTSIVSQPHTPPYSVSQEVDTSQREGSYGLPAQVSLDSTPAPAPAPGTWEGVKEGDSSLVGSGTLQEIRRLLGHAESLVSSHFSVTSSPGSQCYPESDTSFLSLRQNTQAYNDDSFLSVDRKVSLVLARSSSDSALKESSSSSSGPLEMSTNLAQLSKGPLTPSQGKEENLKSRDFRVAPRRAEPEGCSAADPDRAGPVTVSITQGNASTSDGEQQSLDHTENVAISSSEISPTHSQTEGEKGVLSDASSEHSLASRVAKLLQSESSVSVVTSRSSTADPDERRAKEWIINKVSGGKCELNSEDRRRIEEIKRDLLLHTKSSSASESSSQSSAGTVPQPAVGFAALRSAEDRLSEQLQRLSRIPLDSSVPLHTPVEDGVSQIPIKERRDLQHTHSPHSSQHLYINKGHAVHNDNELESNPYPTPRSSDVWKLQTQMTNRSTKSEVGNGTAEKEKELRREDVQAENEKNKTLPVTEAAHTVIRGTREFTPGLESGSVIGYKPTPSVKLQQNTTQRPDNSGELVTGSPTHHLNGPYSSREVPVSNTNKQQQVSIATETNLSKDRNADQYQNTGMVHGNSQMTSRHKENRQAVPNMPFYVSTAANSTLLPYKPHGSSELFYMAQTVREFSPNHSDSAVESSHPGSDDAVPPQFTPEVLGSRELVDNYVTPKHKEGIYSKRAKMKRASNQSGNGVYNQIGNTGHPGQLTGYRKSVYPENKQVPEHIEEEEEEVFIPLHMEADISTAEQHINCSAQHHNLGTESLPLLSKAIGEKEQDQMVHNLGAEIGNSLDQLWHRFNERYSFQETQTRSDVEISLLERLERLSRLLHSSPPPHTHKQGQSTVEKSKSRRRETEPRRTLPKKHTAKYGKEKNAPKTAWEKKPLSTDQTSVEEELRNQNYRCPAERDESASVSVETSSCQSTIDTPRLIRAFGPDRVSSGREGVAGSQALKPSDVLLKLHNNIKKQKRGHDSSGSESHLVSVATDDSMASDTLSSSSTCTQRFQRSTGCNTNSKMAKVKLVSRSIQAGDLEIVVNGTRRDTRDVGTTFPSPGSAKVTRASSGACSEVKTNTPTLRAPSSSTVQTQSVLRRHMLKKQTCYPNGLSWFVPADDLKRDARKENKPQTDAGQSESQAWFEPHTRTQPWREPLRERHIQVEKGKPPEQKTHPENNYSRKSPALVRLTLQEALELHRPEFVSRSRERMKRLCLLAEERKIQAVFNKEREELFNRPSTLQQPKAPAPPPLLSKRVIPISEMIQRSKRIYAQLPEVQKRKEEEKRKAEYYSYRLNAQLFNKKITNHVLGRRAPWQ
ncbi:Alstrom syndrome protein 1 isoform X2 [Silurus asotus]|uniref:Alstrom syndrome protein 1 isoform X2 n=1 Tax=Silurus asotus TaxID=30991 RepID=A0AAD4ZZA1_SILAS|nr:Alstrom syndrome protein 1 isoform X2 [Silurus asotus]